jgi:hypothetical protein
MKTCHQPKTKDGESVKTGRQMAWGAVVLILAVLGCGSSGGTGTGGVTGHGGVGGVGGGSGSGGSAPQTTAFSISTNPTALSLPPGGDQSVPITIDRTTGSTTFTGAITFSLLVPNTISGTGVTATFTPNPATAGSSTLAIAVASGVAAGSYTLDLVGVSGTETYTLPLPLTVTSVAATTLLVDNDASANNVDPTDTTAVPSASDTLFPSLLSGEGILFNSFVAPVPSTPGTPNTPTTADLTNYTTIVWYTGASFGTFQTLSPAQKAILESWLDQGGHTLLMFSENLVYDLGVADWVSPETDTFLKNYIGAAGDADDGDLSHATYNATGITGTVFAGEVFQVIMDQPIESSADPINPAIGTDALVTVVENPDQQLSAATAVPAVVGRKTVGTAATSKVVYVGIPIENILKTTGNNTNADFFHAVLRYVGLKAS